MAWDKTKPTGTEDMSGADDSIRANWAALETCIGATNLSGPTALNDRIIQVVNSTVATVVTCDAQIPVDNSIPQNTEGDEVITATITPVSATNKLLIVCEAGGYLSSAGSSPMIMAIFQDSTANALAAKMNANAGTASLPVCGTISHYMTTGTTSATTFKLRIGTDVAGRTIYVNGNASGTRLFGGVDSASMTIYEIRV